MIYWFFNILILGILDLLKFLVNLQEILEFLFHFTEFQIELTINIKFSTRQP